MLRAARCTTKTRYVQWDEEEAFVDLEEADTQRGSGRVKKHAGTGMRACAWL